MATRHGRKLSYHMLLPINYEGQLEAAATRAGMSVAKYAAHVLVERLDQLNRSAVGSAGQSSVQ